MPLLTPELSVFPLRSVHPQAVETPGVMEPSQVLQLGLGWGMGGGEGGKGWGGMAGGLSGLSPLSPPQDSPGS